MEMTMTNNFGFCELNENEKTIINGGGIGGAVWGATVGFATGMIGTCVWNHATGKETTVGGVLLEGLSSAVSGAIEGAIFCPF